MSLFVFVKGFFFCYVFMFVVFSFLKFVIGSIDYGFGKYDGGIFFIEYVYFVLDVEFEIFVLMYDKIMCVFKCLY